MAGFIGNTPAEKYSSLTQQTFSSPTGTSFTLDQAVTSSVDIALFIDNVRQDPTTYTASGTSLTTSTISSPSTMYCLFNGKTTGTVAPPANSVDSGSVVSGAIDDSHITGMVASKLTGVVAPANLGTGTASASTFLNGAGAYAVAGGGAWTVISTAEASASASVDFTSGINSTYASYAVVWTAVVPGTNTNTLHMALGDSAGFDTVGTNYARAQLYIDSTQNGSSTGHSPGEPYAYMDVHTGTGTGMNTSGMAIFTRPTDGASYPIINWSLTASRTGHMRRGIGSGLRLAAITVDRIQFLFSTGVIASGRFTLYGIAHA